jgi:GT2 family glycosyltransferase
MISDCGDNVAGCPCLEGRPRLKASRKQILAVIVLYKRTSDQSQTIQSLARIFVSHPGLHDSIDVLVWDNSPFPLEAQRLPFPSEYRHAAQNAGVSGAYNGALETAQDLSYPWMLLLDHDTTLTSDYLLGIEAYSRKLESRSEIGAIAPFLLDRDQTISPARIHAFGNTILHRPFSGMHAGKLYAANSGTLMRVSALKEIGGYDERFWLDYSDIVTFSNLDRRGRRLYVAGDLELQHVISSNDYDGMMSARRYRNFMSAEDAYCNLYRGNGGNFIQTLRLFARVIKQYLKLRNKEFSRITWEYFLARIFLRKSRRLMRWKRQLVKRDLSLVGDGHAVG